MSSLELTTASRYRLPSSLRIFLFALGASSLVFTASLGLQWLVYEDLSLRTGQWRITGTSMASILTFLFLYRWQLAERERLRQIQQRLDVIRQMNDKIRNALQIIDVTSYLSQPDAAAPIREAVDVIDTALREGSSSIEQ